MHYSEKPFTDPETMSSSPGRIKPSSHSLENLIGFPADT